MSNIYKNVIELIGKTPLVEVENVEKRFKLQASRKRKRPYRISDDR